MVYFAVDLLHLVKLFMSNFNVSFYHL